MENIKELVKYEIAPVGKLKGAITVELALQSYRNEFLPLTIKGLEDREGYEAVKEANRFMVGERNNVEKRRVELKSDFLAGGRMVDAEAKRITDAILEVENHLKSEKKRIDDEVALIKFEKEQREKLPERIKILTELGEIVSEEEHGRYAVELLKLDDAGFTELVNRLTSEKLERQRIAQEKKDAEQREAQEKIDAENRRIEQAKADAEREEKHKAEVEAAKVKAAADALIQAEIDAKRNAAKRTADAAIEQAERERIESERPDTEKLKSLAEAFERLVIFPDVTSAKAKAKVLKVKKLIAEIVAELRS